MRVLIVEPGKLPYSKDIGNDYTDFQEIVGGTFAACYPFNDDVALICHDEGKILNLTPNRVLLGLDGRPIDVICGTFCLVGLGVEDFESLPDDMIRKYTKLFSDVVVDIYTE